MKKLILILSVCVFGCNTEQATQENETWKAVPVVDDFGEPVAGETGITGKFNGADAQNMPVGLLLSVQDSLVSVSIFDNSEFKASFPELATLGFSIKNAKGETKEGDLFFFQGYIFEKEGETILNTLKSEQEPFKMLINYKLEKYLFEVDPAGFQDLLAAI